MAGIGISFGNTSAFVSICKDSSRAEIIANSAGERPTSTTVGHQEGEILTGTPALQLQIRQPANTVHNLKSLLGKQLADSENSQVCRLEEHNGEIIVNFNNVSRKGVSALAKSVFDNLKETADSVLGDAAHETVIAVPLNATPEYRSILTKCAASAGFTVLDLIPEPIAALLAHHNDTADGNIVVVRIGGASMSVSLLTATAGLYSLVDHEDQQIGGKMFDLSVGKFLCTDFNRKHRCVVEENPRSFAKILRASKTAKHNLSTLNTAECSIESLYDGLDMITTLSRPRFETLIEGDLTKLTEVLRSFIAKHPDREITLVVLSGGCCKVSKLQSHVSNIFPGAKILSTAPDEVVSMGAAQHAALIAQYPDMKRKTELESNGTVAIPVTPRAISVHVEGGGVTVLVPKHTPLPFSSEFQLKEEGKVFLIEDDAGNCLARAEMPEDNSKVSLHLEVFEDCGIEAIIKDCATSERTSVHIPAPTEA